MCCGPCSGRAGCGAQRWFCCRFRCRSCFCSSRSCRSGSCSKSVFGSRTPGSGSCGTRDNELFDMRHIPPINWSQSRGAKRNPMCASDAAQRSLLRSLYRLLRSIPHNLKRRRAPTVPSSVEYADPPNAMAAELDRTGRPSTERCSQSPTDPFSGQLRQSREPNPNAERSGECEPVIPILKVTVKGIWL